MKAFEIVTLSGRLHIVETFVENGGFAYLDRLEAIPDKPLRRLCRAIICTVVGEAYDWYCYMPDKWNLFHSSIKRLDDDMASDLFKWFGFYYLTRVDGETKELMRAAQPFFRWITAERHCFELFIKLRALSEARFETAFAQKFIKDTLKIKFINFLSLAYVENLFYNSGAALLRDVASDRRLTVF
ncbi:MAG: hypothetical protein LBL35_08840 [Clostridiales bacterium]|jgi:hypothetical protein|nr:hypothetical protein [Clostridiales bacterium]